MLSFNENWDSIRSVVKSPETPYKMWLIKDGVLKPTSSLRLPGKSIDTEGNVVDVITEGRHDPCVGIRATPIAEAMVAIVLMDHYLRQRAQNGGATI